VFTICAKQSAHLVKFWMHLFQRCRAAQQRQEKEDRRLQKVVAEATIRLSGNVELLCITGQGLGNYAARLAKVLATNTSLRFLQLDANGIGDAAAEAVVQALTGSSTLQHLDLDYNAITDNGAAKLAGVLKENRALRVLELHCNKIGCAGAEQLAKALETNPALRTLSLHGNAVGDVGTGHLARALEVNTVLRELFLGQCAIGNDGASKLATALAGGNGTLRELHLEKNIIKDEGAHHLAGALPANSALQELWLLHNYISGTGLSSFAEALRHNTTLQRLGITASCNADDEAAAQVLNSLTRNHAMKRALRSVRNGDPVVDLVGHILDDVSVVSLASAIESSDTLRELKLSRSSTWGNTGALLTKALEENCSLEKVSLIDDDIHSDIRSNTFDSVGRQMSDISDPNQVLLIPELDADQTSVTGRRHAAEVDGKLSRSDARSLPSKCSVLEEILETDCEEWLGVCDEHQTIKSDHAEFLRLAPAHGDDNEQEMDEEVEIRTYDDFEEDALQLPLGKTLVQPNHRSDLHPKNNQVVKPEHSSSVGLARAHGDDDEEAERGPDADTLSVCSLPLEDESPFVQFALQKDLPLGEDSQEHCFSNTFDNSSDTCSSVISKGLPLPSEGAVSKIEQPDEASQEPCFSRAWDSSSDSGSDSLSVISKGLPLPSEGAVSKVEQPDEASQEPCFSRASDSSSDSGSDSLSVISKGLPLPSEGAVPGTGIGAETHVSNAAQFPLRLPAAPTAIAGCNRESDIEMAEGYGIGRDLQDAVVSL